MHFLDYKFQTIAQESPPAEINKLFPGEISIEFIPYV